MKFPLLLVLAVAPLLFWQCATQKPLVTTKPKPVPTPAAVPQIAPDDDHRSVSREEFQNSAWTVFPSATHWQTIPGGASVTLKDGREVTATFVSPRVLRWWIPAAVGDQPLSPSAKYPADSVSEVKVRQEDSTLLIDGSEFSVRIKLDDLSWILVRGDKTVVRSAGGPRFAGRRLVQSFGTDSAERWFGAGFKSGSASAKFWIDNTANADNTGAWVAPTLFGAGGSIPFVMTLDNSYQTYARINEAETSLGALNGGLDLLIAADPRASGAVEALTKFTGRTSVPPLWSHGTALALPAGETGAFVRRAKLAIQTAFGVFEKGRPRFQTLVPSPQSNGVLPDLTLGETRAVWVSALGVGTWPVGAGVSLPSVAGRSDWTARFDDQGRDSPLARMNNRLSGIEARTVSEAWQALSPGLRPFVLAESGGLGSVRHALPERRLVAGQEEGALPEVLALGISGLGTPAIRLDLTPLAHPETKEAAFRSLQTWMMAPVLILDWGADPAAFWTSLGPDQQRLKVLLDHRSQFKPLFAQGARQSNATGLPAWRPVWFDSPKDPKALGQDNEFLLGEALLVARVTGEGTTSPVYLPGPGVWFDFWSGEEFGEDEPTTSKSTPTDRWSL